MYAQTHFSRYRYSLRIERVWKFGRARKTVATHHITLKARRRPNPSHLFHTPYFNVPTLCEVILNRCFFYVHHIHKWTRTFLRKISFSGFVNNKQRHTHTQIQRLCVRCNNSASLSDTGSSFHKFRSISYGM